MRCGTVDMAISNMRQRGIRVLGLCAW
jgi:hypothetical protein